MIEKALAGDVEDIFNLHADVVNRVCGAFYPAEIIAVWNHGRSAQDLLAFIENDGFFVIREAGRIIAFVHFTEIQLQGLFVAYGWHGKGLGKRLFEFAAKQMSGRPIQIKATLNAIEFYKRIGCIAKGYSAVRRNERDIYVLKMEYI